MWVFTENWGCKRRL